MAVRTRRRPGCLVLVLLLALVLAVSYALWLPWLGSWLEKSGMPHQADVAVVLAGDFGGERILRAAELAKAGFVPKVLVSGPSAYGGTECDLAIPFAVRHGYPESMFECVPSDARSTRAEARVFVPLMKRRDVRSYLLVTSDYHTRRAGKLFHQAGPELTEYVVAAPDAAFQLRKWWQEREGQKAVLLEWIKTVGTWFGM